MNIGDKVKFTKQTAYHSKEKDPLNQALPIDYENEGVLMSQIRPNICIVMERSKRNGIEVPGIFQTSKIKKIEGDLIYTENSVWKIEVLKKAE